MQVDGPPVGMYTNVPYPFSAYGGFSMASIYSRTQATTITETPAEPPRLLDRMRFTLRANHYSYRTEQAYVYWCGASSSFTGNDIRTMQESLGHKDVSTTMP